MWNIVFGVKMIDCCHSLLLNHIILNLGNGLLFMRCIIIICTFYIFYISNYLFKWLWYVSIIEVYQYYSNAYKFFIGGWLVFYILSISICELASYCILCNVIEAGK